MKFPKISIVTPSFNQGNYIEQTIVSILDQNYPNLEYIIIDGGSTDNTIEVIKKYTDRIRYWVSEPDKGQSDALNKGLAKCTGDIFNWINSDDYLAPGALQQVAEIFTKSDADIVCGYSRVFQDGNNKALFRHRTEVFEDSETTLVQQRINQPAMFYKLSLVRELGGINSSLHYIMDLELWFRYLCNKGQSKIILTDHLLAHFRIHDASKTAAHEQNFRAEEKAMWHYILLSLNAGKDWLSFFTSEKSYTPLQAWDIQQVDRKKLFNAIAKKNLYDAYRLGNIAFCRKAYYQLFKTGKLSANLQNLAMFVKIFIGDIPFRKYFLQRA